MPYPKPNETEKDYIKRCLSDSEMKSKHPEFYERFAVCKSFFENAKIALRWAEEHGWGECGTPVGKQRK